jgi:hypothetical protein
MPSAPIADSASSVNGGFAMTKRRIMTTSGPGADHDEGIGEGPASGWPGCVPGAKVGAIGADDLMRHPNESGQACGDHASSRTDPDDAERLTGIYGSVSVVPGGPGWSAARIRRLGFESLRARPPSAPKSRALGAVHVLNVWWEGGFEPRRAEGFVSASSTPTTSAGRPSCAPRSDSSAKPASAGRRIRAEDVGQVVEAANRGRWTLACEPGQEGPVGEKVPRGRGGDEGDAFLERIGYLEHRRAD